MTCFSPDITIRGADLTLGYANDPHPMNGLIIQSSCTDPSPKGFVIFVLRGMPASLVSRSRTVTAWPAAARHPRGWRR